MIQSMIVGGERSAPEPWPRRHHTNASWLTRQPWCARFDKQRDNEVSAHRLKVKALAPRIAAAVRLRTGLDVGEDAVGFLYFCHAVYAHNASEADVALPCRLVGDFFHEL